MIPFPKSIAKTNDKETFQIHNQKLVIFSPVAENLENEIKWIHKAFEEFVVNFSIEVQQKVDRRGLVLNLKDIGWLKEYSGTNYGESYRLRITASAIEIDAPRACGIFYGLQTLRQIFFESQKDKEQISLPALEICDWPDYPLRGYMLDTGRNFVPLELLKEDVRVMSRYKMNAFHWHLTENEAWRIESKKYPLLNSTEFHKETRDPGKFYTYDQIREFVNFCKKRHVQVIPEIDMPGHSKCFKRAMGSSMNRRKGRKYLKDILAEFFEEIPQNMCPIIHIGSDEVFVYNRKSFVRKMTNFIRKRGREFLMWNPGLPAPEDTILQTWIDKKEAFEGNQRNIDSTHAYLNNMDPQTGVLDVFFNQPCRVPHGKGNGALGGILCLWPDVNVNDKFDIYRHNPVYPIIVTGSERYWNGLGNYNKEFHRILPDEKNHQHANQTFRKFERRLIRHGRIFFEQKPYPYVKQSEIQWLVLGPFSKKIPSISPLKLFQKVYETEGETFSWKKTRGATLNFNRRGEEIGIFEQIKRGSCYALTNLYSAKEQKIKVLVGFDLCARSNRQYGGIPENGQFDPFGSEMWLNGKKLKGPIYSNPNSHQYIKRASWSKKIHEIPFEDEEFYWTRRPYELELQKGDNQLLVKIVKGFKNQNWVFTFLPVVKLPCSNYPNKRGVLEPENIQKFQLNDSIRFRTDFFD